MTLSTGVKGESRVMLLPLLLVSMTRPEREETDIRSILSTNSFGPSPSITSRDAIDTNISITLVREELTFERERCISPSTEGGKWDVAMATLFNDKNIFAT
jgi:hypothetical protein